MSIGYGGGSSTQMLWKDGFYRFSDRAWPQKGVVHSIGLLRCSRCLVDHHPGYQLAHSTSHRLKRLDGISVENDWGSLARLRQEDRSNRFCARSRPRNPDFYSKAWRVSPSPNIVSVFSDSQALRSLRRIGWQFSLGS